MVWTLSLSTCWESSLSLLQSCKPSASARPKLVSSVLSMVSICIFLRTINNVDSLITKLINWYINIYTFCLLHDKFCSEKKPQLIWMFRETNLRSRLCTQVLYIITEIFSLCNTSHLRPECQMSSEPLIRYRVSLKNYVNAKALHSSMC